MTENGVGVCANFGKADSILSPLRTSQAGRLRTWEANLCILKARPLLIINHTGENKHAASSIYIVYTWTGWSHQLRHAILQLWSICIRILTISHCWFHHPSFASATHKCNMFRRIYHRESEGDSLWRWFWRDWCNPFLIFLEEWVSREKRSYMPIRPVPIGIQSNFGSPLNEDLSITPV